MLVPSGTLPNEFTDDPYRSGSRVRLTDEHTITGQNVGSDPTHARCDHKSDVGPADMDDPGKLQAIHPAGHVNVGEHRRNIIPFLKDLEGGWRGRGFDDLEPLVLKDLGGAHTHQRLILYQQNNRLSRFSRIIYRTIILKLRQWSVPFRVVCPSRLIGPILRPAKVAVRWLYDQPLRVSLR
jgi:hypothetical protein